MGFAVRAAKTGNINVVLLGQSILIYWLLGFCCFQVVKDDPPRLRSDDFGDVFKNLIIACLQKNFQNRYNYEQLLNHPFIQEHTEKTTDVATFVSEILDLAAGPPPPTN